MIICWNVLVFFGVVKEVWDKPVHGSCMEGLIGKLNALKVQLKKLHNYGLGAVRDRIHQRREEVGRIQKAQDQDTSVELESKEAS